VIVNGENAAGGFGITEAITEEFLDAGADAVTLGTTPSTNASARLYRAPAASDPPANFPPGRPAAAPI